MNSTTSKRLKGLPQNNYNGRDRLSELPDNVLLHILSFMPIVDAVRTVAIRRFSSLWTHLPILKFRDSDLWGDDDEIDEQESTPRFASFVRNVLFLHKRVPIESFKLRFGNELDFDDPVNKFFDQESTAWITSVIDRQVKNLNLDIRISPVGSILPHCVFTSQFLVVLKLTFFQITEIRRVHMRSLTKLSLRYVKVTNEALNKIILGSPSLQELDLYNVSGLDELRFTAPNIRKLKLALYNGLLDCPNLKILDITHTTAPMQVVDVSSIREVIVQGGHDLKSFKAYLEKFSNAEVFRYFGGQLQFLKQDLPQTRWKCLHMNSVLHGDQLLAICSVLRSSPLVEELILYTDSMHDVGRTCDKSMLSLELPSCLMQRLKTVTMRGYKIPCYGLLRLAEILLISSIALEKLVILPSKNKTTMVNELNFVKQLLSFPRTSTNARVIFGSETCETVESTGE